MMCVFATNNAEKIAEARPIFTACGHSLVTLGDLGVVSNPQEVGRTYLQNAEIKANAAAEALAAAGYNIPVISEDSGLSVHALDGQPGVDSAVLLGADSTQEARCAWVLDAMSDKSNRAAAFLACCVLILPNGEAYTAYGKVMGEIADLPIYPGFGYDPIFFLPDLGKTASQLTIAEKNLVSHRGMALRELLKKLGSADD